MKKLLSTILVSAALIGAVNADTHKASDTFSADQQAQIGKIAAQYLIDHPEVLMQAAQKLQEKQMEAQQNAMTTAVIKNADKLLNTKTTPTAGNQKANIAVIELFDYECVYCHKAAPHIEKLMQNNKDVKYIFQEFPIFSARFEGSKLGAEAAFAIYNLYGSDAYMQFHNALMLGKNANKDEGKLKKDDIMDAVKATKGVDAAKVEAYMKKESPALIQASMDLGQSLGLQGTPAFIIMPTHGANAMNTKVIGGYVGYDALQDTLNQVKAAIKADSKK